MKSESLIRKINNVDWLRINSFAVLSEISRMFLLEQDDSARDILIRILDVPFSFNNQHEYEILNSLLHRAGLYPYVLNRTKESLIEHLNFEIHKPDGLNSIVFHQAQASAYWKILSGKNLILSAPTSFGKSMLIDALVATEKFNNVVLIVPTIALIDETRRRLSKQFSSKFKIITNVGQSISQRNIYVLTQERFLEIGSGAPKTDLFVIDEFYKLDSSYKDKRTIALNCVFYRLLKTGAQFLLLGPNIDSVKSGSQLEFNFEYEFEKSEFRTVATNINYHLNIKGRESKIWSIFSKRPQQTLVFCKSSQSAFNLAKVLLRRVVKQGNEKLNKNIELSEWIKFNFHPKWNLAKLVENGVGVHYGSLPRALSYHILRKFNLDEISLLLCTSTIIEGVNTSAKSIIIYDNQIARNKLDLFTYQNIMGRAGRMRKHFVGEIHTFHEIPDQENKEKVQEVEISVISQPDGVPSSLIINLDEKDLKPEYRIKAASLSNQKLLPIELLKRHLWIEPESLIALAKSIEQDLITNHFNLSWKSLPSKNQLMYICELIFEYFLNKKGMDGAFTPKHLYFKVSVYMEKPTIKDFISRLIKMEQDKTKKRPSQEKINEIILDALSFQKKWIEYYFPRFLIAIHDVQQHIFQKNSFQYGDFRFYAKRISNSGMPSYSLPLEEYGLPVQVTRKLINGGVLPNTDDLIDAIIDLFKRFKSTPERVDFYCRICRLDNFEKDCLLDVIESLT